MSIYKLFAHNLRFECNRFQSIAEVCRKSGINRQQFNKYLAGQALPNSNTLKKICKLFDINDVKLFENHSNRATSLRKSKAETPADQATSKIENFKSTLAALTMMPGNEDLVANKKSLDGYYSVHFPLMGSPDFVVNALMRITTRNGVTYFTRHTMLKSATNPDRTIAIGKHSGVVMTNQRDYYFLGLNKIEVNQLSFLVVEGTPIGNGRVYLGYAIIYGYSTPFACRACMVHIGDSLKKAKAFLSVSGVAPIDDPSIHPLVSHVLSANLSGQSVVAHDAPLDTAKLMSTEFLANTASLHKASAKKKPNNV